MANFIKNTEILGQKCKQDCFGYRSHAHNLLARLLSSPQNTITALVGSVGVGKSFLVREMGLVNAERGPDNLHWLYFNIKEARKSGEVWPDFEARLSRVLRLRFFERAWFNLRLMVEGVRSLVFGKRTGWFVTALSVAMLALLILAFLYVSMIFALLVYFVIVITLLIILVLVSYGFLPVSIALSFVARIAKTQPSRTRDVSADNLLTKIRGSKRDALVVVDGISCASKAELSFLARVHDLLSRNRMGRGVRIVAVLQTCNRAHCSHRLMWQYCDYLELFAPRLSSKRFVSDVFEDEFTENGDSHDQCCQLLDQIIQATSQNLHVLKLIIRSAGYKYNYLLLSGARGANQFSCLIASSIEVLVALGLRTEADNIASVYRKNYPEAFRAILLDRGKS